MTCRSVFGLSGLIVTGALAVQGCGSDPSSAPTVTQTVTVSATPSPSKSAAADPAVIAGIKGARLTLQAFLRAQAEGDPDGCRWVDQDSAFAKGPALRGTCHQSMKDSPHGFRPQELEALRGITVTGGSYLSPSQVVIPFSGLRWTKGNIATPFQDRFVLSRPAGKWLIIK